jgi:hypothetical protein
VLFEATTPQIWTSAIDEYAIEGLNTQTRKALRTDSLTYSTALTEIGLPSWLKGEYAWGSKEGVPTCSEPFSQVLAWRFESECRGRLATHNRRGFVDEPVILKSLHHEQGKVHAARDVALEDGVAHVLAPHR